MDQVFKSTMDSTKIGLMLRRCHENLLEELFDKTMRINIGEDCEFMIISNYNESYVCLCFVVLSETKRYVDKCIRICIFYI